METIRIPITWLKRLATLTAGDDERTAITGIHFQPRKDGLILAVTNARVLALAFTPQFKFVDGIKPFTVSRRTIDLLPDNWRRDRKIGIAHDETRKQIVIDLDNGDQILSEEIDRPFPHYTSVIPDPWPAKCVINSIGLNVEFLTALAGAAEVFLGHQQLSITADDEHSPICLHCASDITGCEFLGVVMPVRFGDQIKGRPHWV